MKKGKKDKGRVWNQSIKRKQKKKKQLKKTLDTSELGLMLKDTVEKLKKEEVESEVKDTPKEEIRGC